jgi:hypothetical protein
MKTAKVGPCHEILNPEILAFLRREETTADQQVVTATPVMA